MFVFLLLLFYVTLESLSAVWLSYIFESRCRLSAREAALDLMLFWDGMLVGRFYIVFLLKTGLEANFFACELALGVAVLAWCLLAFSSCAGGQCPGTRRL